MRVGKEDSELDSWGAYLVATARRPQSNHHQFEKIYVINLPERSDRRDSLSIAAASAGIDIEWVAGVDGSLVDDRVLPPEGINASLTDSERGIWRAHMNVLDKIVEQNIASALIVEDDGKNPFA